MKRLLSVGAGVVVALGVGLAEYLSHRPPIVDPSEVQAIPNAEGYQIVGYDGRAGLWTILRTGTFWGEHQVKRLTLECEFYKWGYREAVKGPRACDLRVGERLRSLAAAEGRGDFIDEEPGFIAVLKGEGSDCVMQQLRIVKYELVK